MCPNDTTSIKTCTKCNKSKPVSEFYVRKDRKNGKAITSWCKACWAEHRRVYYATHKERENRASQAYREVNREKVLQRQREHYRENWERLKAKRDADKERIAERSRKWHNANKERVADAKRRWCAANKERKRMQKHRRRARMQAAEGTYTVDDIKAQYKRQKGRCYYCKTNVGDEYHVDHIVPLSRGGTNWPDNLVVACPTCNWSKNDSLPHEWPRGGRLL